MGRSKILIMSQPLTGQIAVVTGAGRGIGKAIAHRFASEGAKVAVVSRTAANAESATAEINAAFPGAATAFPGDIADPASVSGFTKAILDAYGRVDILVNNAGVTRDTLLMRMSTEDWDTVLNTNLRGAFLVTQAFQRPMLKHRSGRIINIASIIGLIGNAGQANYAASKAGLIGFTKSVAKEIASRGITANVVAPGFTATDMTDVLSDEIKEGVLKQIPLGRLGSVDDIAAAVSFLASPGAGFITGQVLAVDGGMVM